MRLIDAIRNVKIDPDANEYRYSANLEEICYDLEVPHSYDFSDEFEQRFKQYPIFTWNCTDTHVGLEAIYFDGIPVASYFKSARKNDCEIKWVSQEEADKVRMAILRSDRISFITDDDTVKEFYPSMSADESLTNDGYYQGRPVKVLVWYDWYCRHTPEDRRVPGKTYYVKVDYNSEMKEKVLIQDGDNEVLIDISELMVPINVHGVVK